jgi:hypothetical protein
MRWEGHIAYMGERRGAYRVLVRKPEGTRPLGRPRCRWVDNIEMDKIQENNSKCIMLSCKVFTTKALEL